MRIPKWRTSAANRTASKCVPIESSEYSRNEVGQNTKSRPNIAAALRPKCSLVIHTPTASRSEVVRIATSLWASADSPTTAYASAFACVIRNPPPSW
jgi:hypothetical protein